MSRRKKIAWLALAWLLVMGLAYANRLLIFQHSLGWYTDWANPRAAEQPVAWQSGPAQPAQGKRPPNIIVIMADDLGINDVTTHGAGHARWGVSTPAIDSLAQAGVRFDNGYAGSAVCTVSRAAMMTGRYPWRFGVEFTPTPGAMGLVAGELYPYQPPALIDRPAARAAKRFNELGMPASEHTLAEALKAQGYHTVHVGKWHLGSTPEMRPNNQGFNESLFMESGLYLRENDKRVVNSKQTFDPIDNFLWPNMRLAVSYNAGRWFEPNKYLTDYFTDQAVKVIETNRHRPFFLYLAHWGVHTPLQASREDYDALPQITDHRRRVYGAMIRSVDRSVARVLQSLREQGLEKDTLVVFTSDNGAPGYIGIPEVNQPYRGWKLSFFEGGVRVPFVAQWPARIPAGTRYTPPVTGMDIFSTALGAAGAPLPTDRPVDGVNLLAHLAAPAQLQPERPLFWRDGALRAVQHQGWKLIASDNPRKDWLFNLRADPTERNNLAQREPAKLAQLQALQQAHHAGMPPPLWQSFIQLPVFIDKTLDQRLDPAVDEYSYWSN
jgi:arylsulfatase A-like enzyme